MLPLIKGIQILLMCVFTLFFKPAPYNVFFCENRSLWSYNYISDTDRRPCFCVRVYGFRAQFLHCTWKIGASGWRWQCCCPRIGVQPIRQADWQCSLVVRHCSPHTWTHNVLRGQNRHREHARERKIIRVFTLLACAHALWHCTKAQGFPVHVVDEAL